MLTAKCSSQVLTKLEAQDGWKKIRYGDPVEVLKRIKDIVFDHKGVNNPCDHIGASIKGVQDLQQMEKESTEDWATMVRSECMMWRLNLTGVMPLILANPMSVQ